MTNGIKEKDIRDMQKCFDKIETILKRIQVYNPEARIICIESDTIALVNFNGEFIDSAPQIILLQVKTYQQWITIVKRNDDFF